MGWRIAEEVQEHAPTSLTWRELYVACVLANDANENTRVCRPGLLTDERLTRRLRMTDKREILRVIERLAEAKVIERVTRGQKGQQAEFRFLPLGPARPVQGGESAHPEAGQSRPQGGESTHPEAGSGWVVSALRVGDSPAQGGGNTHPSQGPNEDQESSLLPPQRIIRAAGITLGEDDEKRFIEWINRDERKGTPWWRTVAKNGDLPSLVEDWREAATPGKPPNGLPTWCGQCGDGGTAARFNVKLRTLDGLGGSAICPRCHPLAVGEPPQPAPRGHVPYQNPTDHSVYFGAIS